MKIRKKIELYRRLLVLTSILLAIFVILYALGSVFSVNLREYFDMGEQNTKPSFEQKVEKSSSSSATEADKNKDYAPKDNNKVKPAQSCDSSFIYEVSISDLTNNVTQFDSKHVQISGEVIGDLIEVDSYPDLVWICLRSTQGPDDTISVIVNRQDAEQIDSYGKYNVRGTIVQVFGSFHLTCKDHEGECDLHCQNFKIIEKGYTFCETFNIFSFLLSLICCLIAIDIFLFYNIKKESAK
ncbi:MAG: hypothetical protein HUJ51_01525 [Eggerthellaceae bacterium]|nr:hypothetical protein [Eggerthellaceae bacterium]